MQNGRCQHGLLGALLAALFCATPNASAAAYRQTFTHGADFVGANAASVDDLSPALFNGAALAAGKTEHHHQLEWGVHLTRPVARVRQFGATGRLSALLNIRPNSNDFMPDYAAPSVFYRQQLADGLAVALGYYQSQGNEYRIDQALNASSITLNQQTRVHSASVSMGYRFSKNLYFGGGVGRLAVRQNIHHALGANFKVAGREFGNSRIDAQMAANSVVFHLGVLAKLNHGATRWGLTYLSALDTRVRGISHIRGVPQLTENQLSAQFLQPAITTLAMEQQLGRAVVGASVGHHRYPKQNASAYRLDGNPLSSMIGGNSAGQVLAAYMQKSMALRDTLQLAGFVRFDLNPHYRIGGGVVLMQSPSDNQQLGGLGAERWLHFGVRYHHPRWSLAGGVAHLQKSHAHISSQSFSARNIDSLNALIERHALVAGAVVGWSF